jgi:hypothetical protein
MGMVGNWEKKGQKLSAVQRGRKANKGDGRRRRRRRNSKPKKLNKYYSRNVHFGRS